MAAEPNKNSPGDIERAKMMRVLIPAGAIALVVVLVAVIMAMNEGNSSNTGKGKGKGGYPPPTGGTDITKLTDGTLPDCRRSQPERHRPARFEVSRSEGRRWTRGEGRSDSHSLLHGVVNQRTGVRQQPKASRTDRVQPHLRPWRSDQGLGGWTSGHEGRWHSQAGHPWITRLPQVEKDRSRRRDPHLRGRNVRREVMPIGTLQLAVYRCTRAPPPLRERLDLRERGHRHVAGIGGQQRAVCPAEAERLLRRAAGQAGRRCSPRRSRRRRRCGRSRRACTSG